MATVTVVFEVNDVHVGTVPEEWKRRVESELESLNNKSETGLVYHSHAIEDMPNQKLQEKRAERNAK